MMYEIERKVSFLQVCNVEADSLDDLKEKLKTAKLEWDIHDCDPVVESVTAYDENFDSEYELDKSILNHDYIGAENGCIIYNEKEFRTYHK